MTQMTPYPAYRDTGISWLGKIPTHWEVKRLKNALSKNDGGVWGDDSDIYEEGTIVLRSTDVELDGTWNITDPARRKLSATEFQVGKLICGDLLVTKSSGSDLHLGKTALVTKEVEGLNCCFSNFMQRLRANDNDYSPEYIFWILNSIIGREQLNYFGSTTTGLNNLTGTLIGKLFIAAPSLPEQRTIVAYIDRQTAKIDALIAKKQRLLELLDEKRAALISQAVTKGLDPNVEMKDSGMEWLGEVPSHWDVKRLKYITSINYENLPETTDADYIIQYIDISNVDEVEGIGAVQELSFENAPSRARRIVRSGDTIISTVRTYLKAVLYFENPPENQIVSTGFAVLRPIDGVFPKSLFWLIQSKEFIEKLVVHSVGVGYPAINPSELSRLPAWLPPLHEQEEIAIHLDQQTNQLKHLSTKVENAIEQLREYRSALISSAVTGKIDVREPSTSPGG